MQQHRELFEFSVNYSANKGAFKLPCLSNLQAMERSP